MAALAAFLICPLVSFSQNQNANDKPPKRPRLLVMLLVDQLRADYLWRFENQLNGGFKTLRTRGAHFTQGFYDHFPTVTAVGHAAYATGAPPASSGIVENSWYERTEKAKVTSVSDPKEKLIGMSGEGVSPRRMMVSTISDQIKMAGLGVSKTIGISSKDRGAILTAGHMGDAAYWYEQGTFITSSYYMAELPTWVADYNQKRKCAEYSGVKWQMVNAKSDAKPLFELPTGADMACQAVESTPFSNDLLLDFARQAIEKEKLGANDNGTVDVLTISLSANDYVGHRWGPDSEQVKDITIRTDKQLADFFTFLDKKIGLQNVLITLTADHGVAPIPETSVARKMPGGRVNSKALRQSVEDRLVQQYGAANWWEDKSAPLLYLNRETIRSMKLDLCAVQRVAAETVREFNGVMRAYAACDVPLIGAGDGVDYRIRNGFHQRGADVFTVLRPYWIADSTTATHGAAHNYDAHVPILMMGPGIRSGVYRNRVTVYDIAPTIAEILRIEAPSNVFGRVLAEAIE
jgi:hypothetical protein